MGGGKVGGGTERQRALELIAEFTAIVLHGGGRRVASAGSCAGSCATHMGRHWSAWASLAARRSRDAFSCAPGHVPSDIRCRS